MKKSVLILASLNKKSAIAASLAVAGAIVMGIGCAPTAPPKSSGAASAKTQASAAPETPAQAQAVSDANRVTVSSDQSSPLTTLVDAENFIYGGIITADGTLVLTPEQQEAQSKAEYFEPPTKPIKLKSKRIEVDPDNFVVAEDPNSLTNQPGYVVDAELRSARAEGNLAYAKARAEAAQQNETLKAQDAANYAQAKADYRTEFAARENSARNAEIARNNKQDYIADSINSDKNPFLVRTTRHALLGDRQLGVDVRKGLGMFYIKDDGKYVNDQNLEYGRSGEGYKAESDLGHQIVAFLVTQPEKSTRLYTVGYAFLRVLESRENADHSSPVKWTRYVQSNWAFVNPLVWPAKYAQSDKPSYGPDSVTHDLQDIRDHYNHLTRIAFVHSIIEGLAKKSGGTLRGVKGYQVQNAIMAAITDPNLVKQEAQEAVEAQAEADQKTKEAEEALVLAGLQRQEKVKAEARREEARREQVALDLQKKQDAKLKAAAAKTAVPEEKKVTRGQTGTTNTVSDFSTFDYIE